MFVKLTVPIKAIPKGRPRFNSVRRIVYTPERTKNFETLLKLYFRHRVPMKGPLRVSIRIYFSVSENVKKKRVYPYSKNDLDNLAKGILDAGNGLLWVDDSQICTLFLSKRYGQERIEIRVSQMT